MIGARLGSWILDRELGRGGMGCVYLARRDPTEVDKPEQVAIKVLAPELAVDSGFLARFQREIDILRKLDHPNIVRFLESGQQEGRSYFVMEYVAGPSFEKLLAQRGRLPWPEVLELAWQIAPALKHAHDRGIIHRDLKPSNLMLATACPEPCPQEGKKNSATSPLLGELQGGGGTGLVKLTDFGIASLFASPHLTVTGGIVGTAEYLSPEQAAGKPVTRRSDLYSLGVVLYTLMTGRTPFEGDPLDLLHKHRFAQFDRPARIVPEVPHELDAIICELLEKDPSNRPGDGMVLFRRLDSFKRKLAYQATHANAKTVEYELGQSATRLRPTEEGPATMMSRLMRHELERERIGGPVRQFFNRPSVLVLLLAITIGLIGWAFWPLSAEKMYQRGYALMQSRDPGDWETAFDKYFGPLLEKHPDTPHRTEIDEFRAHYEGAKAARQAQRAARGAGPMSEAQWFYQEGMRQSQQGDEAGARRVWKALVQAFRDVPSEEPWVILAERELEKLGDKPPPDRQWEPVRQAMQRVRQLREQGNDKEASAIVNALKELYRGDKQAEAILKE
ncbi:MAG TPA: serine/threonine-protein kinase [Gemmataceae bacterium]|jgi:serine/threonine-protein kinase